MCLQAVLACPGMGLPCGLHGLRTKPQEKVECGLVTWGTFWSGIFLEMQKLRAMWTTRSRDPATGLREPGGVDILPSPTGT